MSSNITYKEKYLKYKSKYLKFKNYIGGANGTEVKVLIILNGIKQEPFSMKVLPTDTILNLKEKIEVERGYPISKQNKVSTVKNGALTNLEDSESVLGNSIILVAIDNILEICEICGEYIENKDLFMLPEKKYIHRLKCLFNIFISGELRLEVLLDNKGILPYSFTEGFLTIDDVKKIKVINDEEEREKEKIVKKWSTFIESIGDNISQEDYWKNIRDLQKKAFVKKFKEEVEKKDIGNLAQLIALEYLFNHCPRCNQFYAGHTSCNALTCPNCHTAFCAICLKDCGKDAHIHIKEHGAALFDKEQVAFGLKERAAKKLIDMVIFLQETPETEKIIDPLFLQIKKTLDEIGITKYYILAMTESKKRLAKK